MRLKGRPKRKKYTGNQAKSSFRNGSSERTPMAAQPAGCSSYGCNTSDGPRQGLRDGSRNWLHFTWFQIAYLCTLIVIRYLSRVDNSSQVLERCSGGGGKTTKEGDRRTEHSSFGS